MIAYCALCNDGQPIEATDIARHMAEQHEIDIRDVERWPDGEPVIIDTTLTPEDFA